MSVRELLARVSSIELTELIASELIEPRGERRADMRAAVIASAVANSTRSSESKPISPDSFMLSFDEREMSEEEIAAHDDALLRRATDIEEKGE